MIPPDEEPFDPHHLHRSDHDDDGSIDWADEVGTVIGVCGMHITHWDSAYADQSVGRPTIAVDVRGHVLLVGGEHPDDDLNASHSLVELALSTDSARWLGEQLLRMAANAEECMVHWKAGLHE